MLEPPLSAHLALVGRHLCEQSLRHLGSLHLLLDLLIDAWRDVDQSLQLQGEVWPWARWLRLRQEEQWMITISRICEKGFRENKNKNYSCPLSTDDYFLSTKWLLRLGRCEETAISWWLRRAALRADMLCSLHICSARLHMTLVYRSKSLRTPSFVSFGWFCLSGHGLALWELVYTVFEVIHETCTDQIAYIPSAETMLR